MLSEPPSIASLPDGRAASPTTGYHGSTAWVSMGGTVVDWPECMTSTCAHGWDINGGDVGEVAASGVGRAAVADGRL